MSICHPLYPLCPLSFWSAADVMNDTCDKVPSVCTRHEILSNAFRMLYIGYVCISMDSIVLFAKLCAVLLLSNVSPPAYVSLILVRHADFKPQPLFLPSLNHSSINFIPTPISDCPVSLLLVQFTWSHRISVLDHGTFICSYTRQRLKKKSEKSYIIFQVMKEFTSGISSIIFYSSLFFHSYFFCFSPSSCL